MAGGSADAAAALVACDRLWGTNLGARTLHALAAELGSDVAFPLVGGSALGTGRGERLVALPDSGSWHWVIATQATGLTTPEVFRVFDDLGGYGAAYAASLAAAATARAGDPLGAAPLGAAPATPTPGPDPSTHLAPGAHESRIGDALAEGDPAALGRLLHNDLTEPALEIRPELGDVLAAFERAGALGQVLSGSGPTVVGLALDADHARAIAAVLRAAEVADRVLVTTAPARGAHLIEGEA
jgi:4-diphosphocytidyl-2-C-methyl-D-erythritol kinase